MKALAGLAYAAYQQKSSSSASAYADRLWQAWQDHPEWAERANLILYWMLGMVWQGLGDSRFEIVREKAQTLLRERGEKIPDDEARQMFLQNVTIHRAVSSEW